MATAEAVRSKETSGAALPYALAVGAAGLLATAYALTRLSGIPALPLEVFCVGAGLALALSLAVIIGALVAFGMPAAVVVAAAAALANGIYPRVKSLPKVMF